MNNFKIWGIGNIYKTKCFNEWKNNYKNSKKFEYQINKLSNNKFKEF